MARGHVAHSPLQGEPQSLATIYQLLGQAYESAIQGECCSFLVRTPEPPGLPVQPLCSQQPEPLVASKPSPAWPFSLATHHGVRGKARGAPYTPRPPC